MLNIKGHNGRFHQLVRSTEMRRLAKEVKNRGQVAEEEESKEMNREKDQIIEDLKQKVIDFEELRLENDKNSTILAKLFDGGIIDQEGELLNHPVDEEEM